MTQYGYGYGYQPYGYGQAAANYMSAYQQQLPYAGAQKAQQQQQQQQAHQVQQQHSTAATHQQQPSVGYSPYTATQQQQAPQQQQQQAQQAVRPVAAVAPPQAQPQQQQQQQQQYHHQTQQHQQHHQQAQAQQPPPPGTTQVSASPSYYSAAQQTAQAQAQQAQAQQAAAAAYYGYSAAYRPQATSYATTTSQYYNQQGQTQQQGQAQRSQGQKPQQHSTTTTTMASGVRSAGTTTSQYGQLKKVSTSSAASSMVTYPAYTPTNYYAAYSKQAAQKAGAQATAQALTSQQQNVVASYIQQKTAGAQPNFFAKRTPVNPQQYYCEVCRISCACAATYKTHLEGKNHKKRLQQQQSVPKESKSGDNYCELCDVVCSNRDAFEAHVRGSKHQKVLSLHRRLGKPIPQINVPGAAGSTTTVGGKTVMVTAPRITFVGGKQLHSTGQTGAGANVQQEIKVYPPGAAMVTATPPKPQPAAPKQVTPTGTMTTTPTPLAGGGQAVTTPIQQTTPTQAQQATPTEEEVEVEPVGEQFVVSVKGDPKVPHATYKCELCDCYFNDDYAKKMHVKGRRHRLNYKKTYQPDLYIEPTKAQKKEIEKKRIKRVARRSTDGYSGPYPQQGGGGGGGGGSFGSGGGSGAQSHASLNELRRQEALELAKRRKQQMMSEDFSRGPGGPGGPGGPPHYGQDGPPLPPPPPHMYHDEGPGWAQFGPPMPMYPPAPPRPHNPHDDKLVLNKHSSIYPVESELKGVEAVVGDTEKALKQLSDDLLTEKCKLANPDATEVKKDEKLRELKGAYRIGAHAIGLLLRGECSVELVLMCANKPTHQLFNNVATRLPAKFESFNKAGETENIYNVTPDPSKASFFIISQVGEHRIQVTVTLTSKAMREEEHVAEGTGGEGEEAAAPVNQVTATDSEAGVLDRGPCLAALAALRHTTWFKTAAATLPSCTIVLRVLKDICHRVPAWGVLDSWMIELLVPKCIISANPDYTKPGDVFRRVIECVASGLFLPGGSGLCDPCETGLVDASAKLTAQERANITLSAQHALRLIAFSKLHLVLGVDPLPPPGSRRLKRQQQQQQQQQQEASESGSGAAPGEEEGGASGEDGGVGEDDVTQTAGVKREPSDVQEESEGVKKIKLES